MRLHIQQSKARRCVCLCGRGAVGRASFTRVRRRPESERQMPTPEDYKYNRSPHSLYRIFLFYTCTCTVHVYIHDVYALTPHSFPTPPTAGGGCLTPASICMRASTIVDFYAPTTRRDWRCTPSSGWSGTYDNEMLRVASRFARNTKADACRWVAARASAMACGPGRLAGTIHRQ